MVLAVLSGCATLFPPLASTQADPTRRSDTKRSSKALSQLRADLTRVFGAPIMARGAWGVDIRSLDTSERIFALEPDRLMMPGSNMKIITVAAAAEILGWDHRFTTTLETSAPVEAGVLRGDLFVRSNGDPTINSRDGRASAVLAEWTSALRAAGIREIDGRIVGDDQAFDDEGIGAGWAWDYLQFGYAAPVGALEFNENLAALVVEPGAMVGDPANVRLAAGVGLRLLNRVSTAAEGSAGTVEYRRHLDQPVLEVLGSIAIGAKPLDRIVAVVNPTVFFAQSLKDAVIERGIRVTGPAVDLDDIAPELVGSTAERRVIVSTASPSLREVATVLMKVSQNLYAETLVKAIGAKRAGLGTFGGGLDAVRSTMTTWGVPEDGYVMADGSGLSRYNYLAPSTIVSILERMFRDPQRATFMATFPVAGKDGSLASRMRRTRAEGNALAKTGSIANVRSLSGYVRTRDGEMLAFAILANDFVIPAATVNWIADLAVEHLANFTRR